MPFESTRLWQKAFSAHGSVADERARERLRSTYRKFWERAVYLSRTIQSDLSGLTLHDERHFTALWGRAALLAGNDFPINPVEAFVFGGAILLHDAGHALATYRHRLDELRQTPQWRDKLAMHMRSPEGEPATEEALAHAPDNITRQVLFETLRALHAERAVHLAEFGVTDPVTGDTLYLIDDDELRKHLSRIIGSIAASHHWSLREVEAELQDKIGAIASLPDSWTIDPIKIACLLRCSDAVQMDWQRTPDFIYGLLNIRGISELHWRSQNRLAVPTLDDKDPEALLFTSTRSFQPQDAGAWWIAFDAINVADRELQQSNVLLQDLGRPVLQVKRIRDANSPERLASHIRTQGWRPVSAEIKISNIASVVTLFGGKALYGNDLTVPIRELIQNAGDAVRARRAIDRPLGDYKGQIVVSITEGDDSGAKGFWLSVEDNGIGMSEHTLVGPLLDFGSSFWSSELLQREFPGLAGINLRQTGRYGIGFFSVFMLTERVVVDSRRFDSGIDKQRSLNFHNGLSLRPLLLEKPERPLWSSMSTRVSLFLDRKMIEKCLSPENDRIPVKITLRELVGRLCPTLDCDVITIEEDRTRAIAHREDWLSIEASEWLHQIELPHRRHWDQEEIKTTFDKITRFMRPIYLGARVIGRAGISFGAGYDEGMFTDGGLLVPNGESFWYDFREGFYGCIDQIPSGPRRSEKGITADLSGWATEQAELLALADLEETQRQTAATNVAYHGGNPTPLAAVIVDSKWVTLPGAVQNFLAKGIELTFVRENYYNGEPTTHLASAFRLNFFNIHRENVDQKIIKFVRGTAWLPTPGLITGSFSLEHAYYLADGSSAVADNSFLGCFRRTAHAQGLNVDFDFDDDAVIGHTPPSMGRRERLADREVRSNVVRTKTTRMSARVK